MLLLLLNKNLIWIRNNSIWAVVIVMNGTFVDDYKNVWTYEVCMVYPIPPHIHTYADQINSIIFYT